MKLDIEKALDTVKDIEKSLNESKPEHGKDEEDNIKGKEKAGNKDKDLDKGKVKKSQSEPAGEIQGQEKDDATNGLDKAPKSGSKDNDVGVKVKKDACEEDKDCDDKDMKKSDKEQVAKSMPLESTPIIKSLDLISDLVKSYNEILNKNLELSLKASNLQKSIDSANKDLEKSNAHIAELEKSIACAEKAKKVKKDADGDEDDSTDNEDDEENASVDKSKEDNKDMKNKVKKSVDEGKGEQVSKAVTSIDEVKDAKIEKSDDVEKNISKDELLDAIRKSIVTFSSDPFRAPSRNKAVMELKSLAHDVETADEVNKSMLDKFENIDF